MEETEEGRGMEKDRELEENVVEASSIQNVESKVSKNVPQDLVEVPEPEKEKEILSGHESISENEIASIDVVDVNENKSGSDEKVEPNENLDVQEEIPKDSAELNEEESKNEGELEGQLVENSEESVKEVQNEGSGENDKVLPNEGNGNKGIEDDDMKVVSEHAPKDGVQENEVSEKESVDYPTAKPVESHPKEEELQGEEISTASASNGENLRAVPEESPPSEKTREEASSEESVEAADEEPVEAADKEIPAESAPSEMIQDEGEKGKLDDKANTQEIPKVEENDIAEESVEAIEDSPPIEKEDDEPAEIETKPVEEEHQEGGEGEKGGGFVEEEVVSDEPHVAEFSVEEELSDDIVFEEPHEDHVVEEPQEEEHSEDFLDDEDHIEFNPPEEVENQMLQAQEPPAAELEEQRDNQESEEPEDVNGDEEEEVKSGNKLQMDEEQPVEEIVAGTVEATDDEHEHDFDDDFDEEEGGEGEDETGVDSEEEEEEGEEYDGEREGEEEEGEDEVEVEEDEESEDDDDEEGEEGEIDGEEDEDSFEKGKEDEDSFEKGEEDEEVDDLDSFEKEIPEKKKKDVKEIVEIVKTPTEDNREEEKTVLEDELNKKKKKKKRRKKRKKKVLKIKVPEETRPIAEKLDSLPEKKLEPLASPPKTAPQEKRRKKRKSRRKSSPPKRTNRPLYLIMAEKFQRDLDKEKKAEREILKRRRAPYRPLPDFSEKLNKFSRAYMKTRGRQKGKKYKKSRSLPVKNSPQSQQQENYFVGESRRRIMKEIEEGKKKEMEKLKRVKERLSRRKKYGKRIRKSELSRSVSKKLFQGDGGDEDMTNLPHLGGRKNQNPLPNRFSPKKETRGKNYKRKMVRMGNEYLAFSRSKVKNRSGFYEDRNIDKGSTRMKNLEEKKKRWELGNMYQAQARKHARKRMYEEYTTPGEIVELKKKVVSMERQMGEKERILSQEIRGVRDVERQRDASMALVENIQAKINLLINLE